MNATIIEVQIHPSCHVVLNYGTVSVNVRQIACIFCVDDDVVMYNNREIVIPAFANSIPTMPTVVLSNCRRLPDDRVSADMKVLFYRKELSTVPRINGRCHPVWEYAYKQSSNVRGGLTQQEWKRFRQVVCAHSADATLFIGEIWKVVQPKANWDDLVNVAANISSELVGMYNDAVPLSECLYRRRLMSLDRHTLGRACAGCTNMRIGKQKRCPCKQGFYYCSKECQRAHWYKEHKSQCEFVKAGI